MARRTIRDAAVREGLNAPLRGIRQDSVQVMVAEEAVVSMRGGGETRLGDGHQGITTKDKREYRKGVRRRHRGILSRARQDPRAVRRI